MKIHIRIKKGRLKGWTIRKSKYGWYDLYSDSGVSQTQGKHTLKEIKEIVKSHDVVSLSEQFCKCSFSMIMRSKDDKPYCGSCELLIDE